MRFQSESLLLARAINMLVPLLLIVICALSLNQSVDCQKQPQNDSTNKSPYQQLSSLLAKQSSGTTSNVYQDASQHENKDSASFSSSMLKTFTRTNNMRSYHLDLHSYRKDAKFVGDPIFVDSENEEHKQRCFKHLEIYENELKSFKEMDPLSTSVSFESMNLADTFGRPEGGILKGHQFWLGSYESCLDFSLTHNETDRIQAHYCLGVAQFPDWNPQDSKTSVKVGLCLPETCTSSMLSENREVLETVERMMKYQFGENVPFNRMKLRDVYCLPHDTSQIRQYSWSAVGFFVVTGLFVVACLIATTIDYLNSKLPQNFKSKQERTWRSILVDSFSIIRNFEKFITIRENAPQEQPVDGLENTFDRSLFLNSTTGLKCIGLIWIISAHTFLVTPINCRNLLVFDKLAKTNLASIYLTANLMVDTFFTLSGLLAAYFIFKNGIETITRGEWIILTIHRYWRLTPIYLICYWFTKSVGFLTNKGPLWDYMTSESSPRLNCYNESWLEAILHMSDFKSPKEHCVPFAWFIANGIKFWLVTPFLLILIHKSMRRGYATIMSILVLNIALVTTLTMKSNVDMKSVIEFKPELADNMLSNMSEIYTRPYSRIGTYLIGLLAGHLIYLIDENKLELKFSNHANTLIWTLVCIIVMTLTFLIKIVGGFEIEEEAIPWIFSISTGLIRPIWAICTCWLIYALSHGQVRWLSRFLSANFWRLLVKLSFCAYLSQGEVIAQIYLASDFSDTFSYVDGISRPMVTTVMTMAVSFVMLLVLEYPLVGIERLILPERNKNPSSLSAKESVPKIQGKKKL